MKITNVSPIGDLDVPLLGRIVHGGETVEVTDDQAATLAAQASNWQVTPRSPTADEAVDAPASNDTTITPEEPAGSSTTAETPAAPDSATGPEPPAEGAAQPTTTDTSTTSTEGSEH